MNLILLSEKDFIEGSKRVRFRDRRLKHVLTVHRATVGDELYVGRLNGEMGTGRVTRLESDVLEMEVDLFRIPPPAIPLTLVLALPRPKMLKRILMAVSSMGVKHIVLLNSYRVEKSFWQSPVLEEGRLNEYLTLGLEQAKDTVTPELLLRPRFKPFVEDELPQIVNGSRALVAHPNATESCPRHINSPVTLAVGPEGGFIPYEIDKFVQCGFQPVHIGERILRVETAVTALLARLF